MNALSFYGLHVSLDANSSVRVSVDNVDAPWRLRAHASPCPIAGWCVIELVRAAATLDQLTPLESQQFGFILSTLSAAIRQATGCQRVYVTCFGEVHRQVHAHVVPRHESDARSQGWAVADLYRHTQSGAVKPADALEHEQLVAQIATLMSEAKLPAKELA